MVYARTIGVKDWVCPNCSHFNRTRVNAINGYHVTCRGANCQRRYVVGEIFYRTVPGIKAPPPDRIIPSHLASEPWHSGQTVNRLMDDPEPVLSPPTDE